MTTLRQALAKPTTPWLTPTATPPTRTVAEACHRCGSKDVLSKGYTFQRLATRYVDDRKVFYQATVQGDVCALCRAELAGRSYTAGA